MAQRPERRKLRVVEVAEQSKHQVLQIRLTFKKCWLVDSSSRGWCGVVQKVPSIRFTVGRGESSRGRASTSPPPRHRFCPHARSNRSLPAAADRAVRTPDPAAHRHLTTPFRAPLFLLPSNPRNHRTTDASPPSTAAKVAGDWETGTPPTQLAAAQPDRPHPPPPLRTSPT